MNNLERIKAMEDSNLKWILWGFAMGWSAVIQFKDSDNEDEDAVISILSLGIYVKSLQRESCRYFPVTELSDYKIVSWIYGGQLAGSEAIPEGQKFRVKKTGEILPLENAIKDAVTLKRKKHPWLVSASKSEIEPYFE